MNLFTKDPKIFFEIIFSIILVVLAALLILILNRDYFYTLHRETEKNEDVIPVANKDIQDHTDILYIKLDSPSYAMSNFDINPATTIEVYLAELVDVKEFVQSFSLINEQTNKKVDVGYMEETRKLEESGKGLHNWEKMWKQKITFIPNVTLSDKSSYIIEIAPFYHSADGASETRSAYKYEFTTTDRFGFLNSNLTSGKDFPVDEKIRITFKSPLNYNSLINNIDIEPSVGDIDLKITDKILQINNIFAHNTLYKITIPASTIDLYNRILGKDLIFEFKTTE
ncbi:hypothetical protein A2V49_03340 [candidate division WWE3 bacterium RBG_19FT_COMBO_34_6]|uniref:SbsA Ig-like domain-containing protein n=1 Tax=candidate division WWE3 bacterium RBG_19FT_COMBO_34_6 TaxID=1802612 RepID=A0A1F4UKG3_UNCKA|nr:MAG: hypothetical protein A2V49_03340 [candidate division WWE3 bacterium RBG_19FT_COMBO_34_6]